MRLGWLATVVVLWVAAAAQEAPKTATPPVSGAESAAPQQSPPTTQPSAPATGAPSATAPTQAAPNHTATQPTIKFAPESVKPDAPVITVKGLCSAPKATASKSTVAKAGAACKTVVTRAEFERLISLLGPNLPAAQARLFANRYAQTLVMAAEAKKRGFDKEPEVAELMRYAQMQILEHELTASMQKNSARLADRDAETYYMGNKGRFERADLLVYTFPGRGRQKQQLPRTRPPLHCLRWMPKILLRRCKSALRRVRILTSCRRKRWI